MSSDNLKDVKIGFIGAGNMAKAIGGGLIKNGVVDKSHVFVYAPSLRNFEWWADIGASWVENRNDIVSSCNIIFLAMKPQTLKDALKGLEITSQLSPKKLWASILAGTTLETLEEDLKRIDVSPSIIRIMPNTPMTVGHGCSVFSGNSYATEKDLGRICTILGSLGKTFHVKEEMIDSISSVIGSGPAYLYVIIEAMSDAGVKMGIPRAMAIQFAAQTMVGAGQLVLQSAQHPGALKDEVCSPGGSTIVGLHVLEQRGVRAAMIDTLEAAAARNKVLGKLSSNR